MPKQEAVAWAVEQINVGNLAGAKQLLDALLAQPLSKFGKQERLGAFLARGTAWAMLAKHGQLQGAAPSHVGASALSAPGHHDIFCIWLHRRCGRLHGGDRDRAALCRQL